MRINPQETLAGLQLLKIRDLLQHYRLHSPISVALFFNITRQQALSVLTTLTEAGYLRQSESSSLQAYENTSAGELLGRAKVISGFSETNFPAAEPPSNPYLTRWSVYSDRTYEVQLIRSFLKDYLRYLRLILRKLSFNC